MYLMFIMECDLIYGGLFPFQNDPVDVHIDILYNL
jgi:hypothetical protein